MEGMSPIFVDTHSHLAMLEHDTLENILERAQKNGVTQMLSVSTDEGSWESNKRIAETHPNIFYTLGLHPHDATRWPECAGELQRRLASGVPAKCVAIGEMGLDFHYEYSPRDIQIDVLDTQLTIAKTHNLPVIMHCRDSFVELYERIKTIGLSAWGGVMHCFTGDKTQAKEALDLGLYISFSGILTFKNAEKLREAAKVVPVDRLLLETDCPFLAPIPNRGKPNEPSYLPLTAAVLASTTGKSVDEIAEITTANARTLFQLDAK
jgi:TatD DNase family protein